MKDIDKAAQELLKQGQKPIEVRVALVQQGFLEEEVDKALNENSKKQLSGTEKQTNRLLATKESFEKNYPYIEIIPFGKGDEIQ